LERQGHDAGAFGALGQSLTGSRALGVAFDGDVETAQCRRERCGGKMVGRAGRDHRQGMHGEAQRQNGLNALAGDESRRRLCRAAKADSMAKQRPQSAARCFDRRLVEAIGSEPGAMNRGEDALDVGDGRDQGGEGAGRVGGVSDDAALCAVIPIVTALMEAKRARVVKRWDSEGVEIAHREPSGDRQ
jgi:hypothetical protein